MNIFNILNSNFIQTAVILITGLVAFIIYKLNKYNEKKDAANIIINEIRMAEKSIQEIKKTKNISELSIILPNNTWQSKKHLFLNKLDDDEINLINDFYYKCSYAEQYRQMMYNIINDAIYSKSNYMQEKLIDIMIESIENQNISYENKKQKLIDLANNESWIFSPETPSINVINYIHNIIFITPTNAGTKLKSIAK